MNSEGIFEFFHIIQIIMLYLCFFVFPNDISLFQVRFLVSSFFCWQRYFIPLLDSTTVLMFSFSLLIFFDFESHLNVYCLWSVVDKFYLAFNAVSSIFIYADSEMKKLQQSLNWPCAKKHIFHTFKLQFIWAFFFYVKAVRNLFSID